jgi:hypothetical protein
VGGGSGNGGGGSLMEGLMAMLLSERMEAASVSSSNGNGVVGSPEADALRAQIRKGLTKE